MAILSPVPRLVEPWPSDGVVAVRPWKRRDSAALARIAADPGVVRFTYFEPGFTESDARRWIAASRSHWDSGLVRMAVADANNDEPLGVIGLEIDWRRQSAEVFYWLASYARRQGVMTRGLVLVSRWAFAAVGVERLFLIIEPVNEASERVAKRAGYIYEGLLRSYQPFKGRRPDFGCWSLLPSDVGLQAPVS